MSNATSSFSSSTMARTTSLDASSSSFSSSLSTSTLSNSINGLSVSSLSSSSSLSEVFNRHVSTSSLGSKSLINTTFIAMPDKIHDLIKGYLPIRDWGVFSHFKTVLALLPDKTLSQINQIVEELEATTALCWNDIAVRSTQLSRLEKRKLDPEYAIIFCKNLINLDLSNTRLDRSRTHAIQDISTIKMLNLDNFYIEAEGFDTPADNAFFASFFPNLTHLNLSRFFCTTSFLKTLIEKCPHITHLNVSFSSIEDGDFNLILSLQNLTHLNVQNCLHVTKEALEAAERNHPSLTIISTIEL